MTVLVIRHRVADYEAWKRAFDSDPVGRARGGVTRHTVQRATDDPRFVEIRLEFPATAPAEAMLARLRALWGQVGDRIGFGGAEDVEARLFEEVESVAY